MSIKLFFSSLLFLAINTVGSSQSIYHFQYSFPGSGDATSYDAFFVRHDDGSGFMRVKYKLAGNDEIQMAEIGVQEQYAEAKPGEPDTNTLVYKTMKPDFIFGNSSSVFKAPVFWFTKGNGLYEPAAVTTTEENSLKDRGIFSKKEYLKADNITKDLVLQFFSQEEDFYTNLFINNTRGLSAVEKKTRIFLLVIANTNDPIIGAACGYDMERTLNTYKDLAVYLGLEKNYFPKTISGKLYNKKNIQQSINEMKPSKNDIVIFYYSGHGFRKTRDKKRYPYLDFRAKPADDYNVYSMNLEEIFSAIRKKGARFNLVYSDCCNNDPDSTNAMGTPIPEQRGSGLEWNEDNCRALFLNTNPMSILATAADIGQKAACNVTFGGFFSYYFKASMENYFSVFRTAVTWDQVLQAAQRQTISKAEHTYCAKPYVPQNICRQYPFYKIVFGN